jgi:hypothetical protein
MFMSMEWDDASEIQQRTGRTVHLPGDIWAWSAMMEWYWQDTIEELWEKPVPVPLRAPQIPHGLTRTRTQASTQFYLKKAVLPCYQEMTGGGVYSEKYIGCSVY